MADGADTAVLEPEAADVPATDSGDDAPREEWRPLVLLSGVPESSRSRLAVLDRFELTEDLDRAGDADIVMVSTRMPPGRAMTLIEEIRAATPSPILALVHAGGQDIAAEVLAAGGSGLVAEGNEGGVVAYLGESEGDEPLVDSLEQSQGKGHRAGLGGSAARDPVTRLLGADAFESRLGQFHEPPLPRLAFLRLRGIDELTRRLSLDAADLLRRRIAVQLEEACRHRDAEIFATGHGEFAVLAESVALTDFERLLLDLGAITATFSPDRTTPLAMAAGHAGPEATGDPVALRDLARRGLELASEEPDVCSVVGADELAKALAASTELEAALEALAVVERADLAGPGHGARVAKVAAAIAEAVGLEGRELGRVRLAAQFADIGKLGLDEDVLAADPETLDGAAKEAYRGHPEKGAAFLRVPGGDAVAEMVRCHHEHWDGSGFPDGLSGEEIPMGARIIAVADALDRWSEADAPTPDAVAKVAEAAGTRFDPGVAEAARRVFG